jgi:hypothetical protein
MGSARIRVRPMRSSHSSRNPTTLEQGQRSGRFCDGRMTKGGQLGEGSLIVNKIVYTSRSLFMCGGSAKRVRHEWCHTTRKSTLKVMMASTKAFHLLNRSQQEGVYD